MFNLDPVYMCVYSNLRLKSHISRKQRGLRGAMGGDNFGRHGGVFVVGR